MLCTSRFMDDVTFGRSGPYGASGVATTGRSLMSMNALFAYSVVLDCLCKSGLKASFVNLVMFTFTVRR